MTRTSLPLLAAALFLSPIAPTACGGSSSPGNAGAADSGVSDAPDAGDAVRESGPPTGDPPACDGETGTTAPAPRGDHAAALDEGGARLVMFGGDVAVPVCGGVPARKHVGDTWMLDVGCGTWREIGGDGPGARARHAMVSDLAGHRAVSFGGRTRTGDSGNYTLFDDVWAFDFTAETWAKLATTGTAPSPRANTAVAIDGRARQLVVFGGNTNPAGLTFTPKNDTFVLDLQSGGWKQLATTGAPPARLFHAMAIDDVARVAYVFSGGDENAFTGPFLADTWALDLEKGTWTELKPTGDPPRPRINHAAVFDRVGKRMLVFGGHDDGNVGNQNDVWALDVASTPPAWKRLPGGDAFNKAPTGACGFAADFTTIDTGAPERRSAFAIGTIASGRGFVVHGGKSDCGVLGDAWWFSGNADKWTKAVKVPAGLSCLRYSTTCSGLCG